MLAVGVLGGTFDPVHVGHLAAAVAARDALALDLVLLVPARPWQKTAVASDEDRLTMCELAADDAAGLAVSRVDIDRPGPTYSVDTLRDLAAQLGPEARLHFIVGADALAGVPSWRTAGELAGLARFAALRRPGNGLSVPEVLAGAVDVVDMPPVDVSSTRIRECVAEGASIDGMVAPSVAAYIHERGLYRGAA